MLRRARERLFWALNNGVKMNKRGASNEQIAGTAVYLIILSLFTIGMLLFVYQLSNRAALWEDDYAKEIVKIVNALKPGDEFTFDVHKATEVAKKNRLSMDNIFIFDNAKNEICVKLSPGKKSCYSYFSEIEFSTEMKFGVPGNVLIIKAKEGGKNG